MARAIRFTKPEREALKLLLESDYAPANILPPRLQKAAEKALAKIEVAEFPLQKRRRAGVSLTEALEAFRGVLGGRLVVPRTPGTAWYAAMNAGLSRSTYSADDCVAIARAAASQWKGPIKAESLVRQGDVLLSNAESGGSRGAAQTELEDL